MARPTGQASKARRVPLDVDQAIQREADRRGTSWADELRRAYVGVTFVQRAPTINTNVGASPRHVAEQVIKHLPPHPDPSPADAQAMASGEASSVDPKPEPGARIGNADPKTAAAAVMDALGLSPARCHCQKPVMSKTVTNVCTVCHRIR